MFEIVAAARPAIAAPISGAALSAARVCTELWTLNASAPDIPAVSDAEPFETVK